MSPSLFTRLAAAEDELRSVKDTLDEVLAVLAEMKASQDAGRRDDDERRRTEFFPRGRRWRWRALRGGGSFLGRVLLSVQAAPTRLRAVIESRNTGEADEITGDELVFWKEIARTAITGLFLLTLLMIGLYHILNYGWKA